MQTRNGKYVRQASLYKTVAHRGIDTNTAANDQRLHQTRALTVQLFDAANAQVTKRKPPGGASIEHSEMPNPKDATTTIRSDCNDAHAARQTFGIDSNADVAAATFLGVQDGGRGDSLRTWRIVNTQYRGFRTSRPCGLAFTSCADGCDTA